MPLVALSLTSVVALAPIIFGEGYNEVRQWWVTGAVIAVLGLVVTLGFGPIWWSIVGFI